MNFIFSFFFIASLGFHSARAELTLKEAIQSGIKNHPLVQSEHYGELRKQQDEAIAQSQYYPKISAMALATTGFPGSAGATAVAGLMVSPYHKGPSAGLFLEQNILDFGRTSGQVKVAEKESRLFQTETHLSKISIAKDTERAYYLCSRDRSLSEIYSHLALEAELIQKEVKKFVQVGQRSVVENYLSRSQTEEARTLAEDYQKKFQLDNQRLALFTAQGSHQPICPPLTEEISPLSKNVETSSYESPFLEKVDAQIALSEAEHNLAKKDFNPRIVGIASLGWMQDTEFNIPIKNYSAAIGLILPLFEGNITASRVKKYELRTLETEKEKEAIQFKLDQENLEYLRNIESARLRIDHLKTEFQLADEGYKMAKKRYLTLQGTLVDVRESLRNLSRTSGSLKEALFEYATQKVEMELLNGKWNTVLRTSRE